MEMAKSKETAEPANASPAKGFAGWQALTKALFDDYRPEAALHAWPGAEMAREV